MCNDLRKRKIKLSDEVPETLEYSLTSEKCLETSYLNGEKKSKADGTRICIELDREPELFFKRILNESPV